MGLVLNRNSFSPCLDELWKFFRGGEGVVVGKKFWKSFEGIYRGIYSYIEL